MAERRPDAVRVLLVTPSTEVQAARLRGRGDPEDHVERRLALGREEEAEGRKIASHVVVNDDLDRAVVELRAIVDDVRRAERLRS